MNPDPTSLARLRDIIAPPPVPWWPPAAGWYWVLGAFVLLLSVALVRGVLHWQHNRYRREALAEWRRQEVLLRDPIRRAAALASLAELLKRTALSAFPREQVASLTGPAWLAFLNRTGATTDFTAGPGGMLEKAAYDPRTVAALDERRLYEAAALARHWLKHHRTGAAA